MFPPKKPFGVPELFDPKIDSMIRRVVGRRGLIVTIEDLRTISLCIGTSIDSMKVASSLCTAIDNYGSHANPVYRSLCIFTHLLQNQTAHGFAEISKFFLPEIRSILCLSFDKKETPLRKQIHFMAQKIVKFLEKEEPIPCENRTAEEHEPAKEETKCEEEDSELSVDPREIGRSEQRVQSTTEDLCDLKDVKAAIPRTEWCVGPISENAKNASARKPLESIDPLKDPTILMAVQKAGEHKTDIDENLVLVTKTQFDPTIESF